MSDYPIHYSEDGTMAWSCIDADDVMSMPVAYLIQDTDPDPQGIWEGYVEGPKWLGLRSWLHELAMFNDVGLDMTRYSGWIREKVFFKFTGKRTALEKIKKIIDETYREQMI